MAISVKDLKQMDEISIRTEHSEYRFRVTDPAKCRGFLSGGLLGQAQLEACLCDTSTADQRPEFSTNLEIGRCALFFVKISDRFRRLTTSIIQDISLVEIPTQAPTEC
jgi:hypothetical protein